jgi:hypothetical protein
VGRDKKAPPKRGLVPEGGNETPGILPALGRNDKAAPSSPSVQVVGAYGELCGPS